MMKKLFVLLLAAALLCSLAACGEKTAEPAPAPAEPTPVSEPTEPVQPEPAAEPEPAEKTLADYTVAELLADPEYGPEFIREALVEVAREFQYKVPYVQYDLNMCTVEPKINGPMHRTTEVGPEYAAWDTEYFDQCSGFCYDVYYETMGVKIAGGYTPYAGSGINGKNPLYPVYYNPNDPDALHDRAEAVKIFEESLLPGDIIYTPGHLILYVGDFYGDGERYCMHCWPVGGGSLDPATGVDKHEPNGALPVQTLQDLCLGTTRVNGMPLWSMWDEEDASAFGIYRPYLAEDMTEYHLTPSVITRLTYPGIDIRKSADRSVYDDVRPGEQIVMTQTVTNHGKQDYADLPVEEPIPAGTELVSADKACTVDGDMLRWTLNVPAGQTVTMTWTLKNTTARGGTLDFVSGHVGQIPTRFFQLRVGGEKLTDSQNDAMLSVAAGSVPASITTAEYLDARIFEVFYQDVLGVEIDVPDTLTEYVEKLMKKTSVIGVEEKMLKLRDDAPAKLTEQIINLNLSGQYVTFGKGALNRIMQYMESYFTPGDCFISFGGGSTNTLLSKKDAEFDIYLGNGKVLQYTSDKGAKIVSFANSIALLQRQSFVSGFRPTIGYDDLRCDVAALAAADAEVMAVEQLNEAAQNGQKAGTVTVYENLSLTQTTDLSAKKLVLTPGKKIELGNSDLIVRDLVCGADAGLTSQGSGRLVLKAGNEAQVSELLQQYAGQAVRIECDFGDSSINNTYDCLRGIAHYNSVAADGAKNLTSIFKVTPAGWTVRMNVALVTNTVQNIANPITLDLNGLRLGVRSFTGSDFTVVNSNPSGEYNYLCFRGNGTLSADEQASSIYAPGIAVQLGFDSASSSSSNSVALNVKGTLTCGEVRILNGSTFTGNIVENKEPLPVEAEPVLTVPELSEMKKFFLSGTKLTLTEDLTLTESLALTKTELTVAAGKTLNVDDWNLTLKGLTLEAGATVTGRNGRVILTAASEKDVAADIALYSGQAVLVNCNYDKIVNAYDCFIRTGIFTAPAADGKDNIAELLRVCPSDWIVQMRNGLVTNTDQTVVNKGLTLDLNGSVLGVKSFQGEDFSVVNSGAKKGTLYYRGQDGGINVTLEQNITAGENVVIGLGYSTFAVNLTVNGSITCREIACNNGSTYTGNVTVG